MNKDDKALELKRAKNTKKVKAYRARRTAAAETAIKTGQYWAIPTRIDTTITSGVAKAVKALSTTTGTSKNIIIERALIEYCIKYRKYISADYGTIQPHKLKDSELLPLDKQGRLYLTALPKNKPLDFPPVAE